MEKSVIAISGKSGCGNTTVSRLLAKKLGYRLINYTFRTMALEMGIPFKEILRRASVDPQIDKNLDMKQVQLASEGSCVLGSRLAVWLMKENAFTVYLKASLAVRAGRILRREGGTLEEVSEITADRDRRDHDRFLSLYGIDNDDFTFVDLIVDAEAKSAEGIVALILGRLEARRAP